METVLENEAGFTENERLASVLTIMATCFSLVILTNIFAAIMGSIIPLPDIGVNEKYVVYEFRPEPLEKYSYYFILLCLPFLIVGFQKLFLSIHYKEGLYHIFCALFALFAVCLAFFSHSFRSPYGLPAFTYVRNSFFFNRRYLYVFLVMYCGVLFFTYKNIKIPLYIKKIFSLFLYIVLFICSAFVILYYWQGPRLIAFMHFDAVVYPIAQVVNGKFPLVDFSNLYGLYPVFIAPIVRVFGFTLTSVTGIFAAITALSIVCVYVFLKNILQSRLILLISFIGFIFIYLLQKSSDVPAGTMFDPYYQYLPIRFIFPTLFLGISANYFKKPSKIIYFALILLACFGVLWNLDSGVVILLTLIFTLIYKEVLDSDFHKNFIYYVKTIIKKSFLHIIIPIISLMMLIGLYCIYTYIQCRSFPEFNKFIENYMLFSGLGYYNLPMSKWHPWILYALIHIVSFSIAVSSIFTKKNKYLCTILFMTGLLGSGLFSYYQGRSHDSTYWCIRYPAILLCIIFMDMLYLRVKHSLKRKRIVIGEVILFSVLLFFFFSPVCSLFDTNLMKRYIIMAKDNLNAVMENKKTFLDEYAGFIKKYSSSGEEIIILTSSYIQGCLYGLTGTSNPVKMPALVDLSLREDYEKLVKYIDENEETKLFIENSYIKKDISTVISKKYKLVDSFDALVYYRFEKDWKSR